MSDATIPFSTGSPIMICGPTGSGKTFFVFQLLKNKMFTQKVSKILYCYGFYQDFYDTMLMPLDNIIFHEGIPNFDEINQLNDGEFNIIILDDLMEKIIKNIDTQNLFTKYCHHYNITTIFLTQNIFAQGPCSRNINLNTHILILFANKRDESQMHTLGKQLFPGNKKAFIEAFEDATNDRFGYLVVDCDPSSPIEFKLRTNIFPGENTISYLKPDDI